MRGVQLLHPELQAAADAFIAECVTRGLDVLITETWRSVKEQDALYAKGRTEPGSKVTNARGSDYQSPHQWGVAFDFCRNVRGHEYDNRDGFFNAVGSVLNALKAELGLFWGGDFKGFVDMPHAEMMKFMLGNSTSMLRSAYSIPDVFFTSWSLVSYDSIQEATETMIIYRKLEDVPEWGEYGRETVRKLIERGALSGTGESLDISEDMLRVLVVNDRMGLYDGKCDL